MANASLMPDFSKGWPDAALECVLMAELAFMPFAFGVVDPWSEAWVAAITAVIAAILVWKQLNPQPEPDRPQRNWSWSLVPVGLFVLLVLFQLNAWPTTFITAVSPYTAALRQRLLGDLPNYASINGASQLTFYPLATQHDLRIMLIATVHFVASLQVYRDRVRIRRLVIWIAAVGAAAIALALLQDVSETDSIYWRFRSPLGHANSGPYVNYSNFGQFVNLSIGAALALLLVGAKIEARSRHHRHRRSRPDDLERHKASEKILWVYVPVTVIVGGTVALFLSLSRGGMMSLLIGGAITGAIVLRRRQLQTRRWMLAVLGVCIFVGLLYAGFDKVCSRLETLQNSVDPSSGRFQTDKDILQEFRHFPLFGTGLGTHQFVYPLFDRSRDPRTAAYADSDWFQLLEEMGICGTVLVLWFLAIIAYSYVRGLRSPDLFICGTAAGLGYGLFAVIIHSMTDFGQHLPSIGCISALYCGLLINLARLVPAATTTWAPASPLAPRSIFASRLASVNWRIPRVGSAGILLAAMIWVAASANRSWGADVAQAQALALAWKLDSGYWAGSDDDYISLLSSAQSACDQEPNNVQYRYCLDNYRWRAISRPMEGSSHSVLLSSDAFEFTRHIVEDLNQARVLCPTFGPVYSLAGQLETFVLSQPKGASDIRIGHELAPNDSAASFAEAALDGSQKRWDESLAGFRRCIQIDPLSLTGAANFYLHDAARPDLAIALANDDPVRLWQVVLLVRKGNPKSMHASPDSTKRMEKDLSKAVASMRAAFSADETDPATLAAMAFLCRDQHADAAVINYLQKAVARSYGQADWHLDLARALGKLGRTDDALHEAYICLRLRPQDQGAIDFINDLYQHPETTAVGDSH